MDVDIDARRQTLNQKLITPLRESIVDKPPYVSGTLQLPDSCFSVFYKTAKDGVAARFAASPSFSRAQRVLD
jgi:hypothetical protein